MTYTWGPLRGDNLNFIDDYFIICDEVEAKQLLRLFEDWSQENLEAPDLVTLQAHINISLVLGRQSENTVRTSEVFFQSNHGDGSPNALMGIHTKDGSMIIIQDVFLERGGQSGINLVQINDRSGAVLCHSGD